MTESQALIVEETSQPAPSQQVQKSTQAEAFVMEQQQPAVATQQTEMQVQFSQMNVQQPTGHMTYQQQPMAQQSQMLPPGPVQPQQHPSSTQLDQSKQPLQAPQAPSQLPKYQQPTFIPNETSQPYKVLPQNPYLSFIKAPPVPRAPPVQQGQPKEQTELLKELLTKDAFNTYCVECGKNKSTHFNVTFGIFICDFCARIHWQQFDMTKSYVKACFTETWDKHQLKMAQMFGNRPFFEFIKQYNIQKMTIQQRYKTIAVKYYRDRLNYQILGCVDQQFAMRPVPTIHEGGLTKKQLKERQRQQAQPSPYQGASAQPYQAQVAAAAPQQPGRPLVHQ